MKRYLLVMLLTMMFSFSFAGISQAGQCVYRGNIGDLYYYYDSSSVLYSGNIVSFDSYGNALCKEDISSPRPHEIDCAKRLGRDRNPKDMKWSSWYSIRSGSPLDGARIKLCR